MKNALTTFCAALMTSTIVFPAFAADSFAGKTPACEVPVFHWTTSPLSLESANTQILNGSRGAIEANTTLWNPQRAVGDLAGQGYYFEADPFTSSSYGTHLVIAYLKANQPTVDVRKVGELDDPDNLAKAIAPIRSEGALLSHRWVSMAGATEAVVLRARKETQPAAMPIDWRKTEVVVADVESPRMWKDHKLVLPGDSLSTAISKFTDRMRDMTAIWFSSDLQPTDDLLWNLAANDFSQVIGDSIGDVEVDKSGTHWIPFDGCGDFETPAKFQEAVAAFAKAGLIDPTSNPKSTCELKAAATANFRKSPQSKPLLSMYAYIQAFKKRYGIKAETIEDDGTFVSTLSATCRPN